VTQQREITMNTAHPIRRLARLLATAPAAGLAFAAAVPAALASASPGQARALSWADPPRPLPPGWNKHPPLPASPRPALRYPPGWNKHPPLPAHAHTLATGGLPAWQLTLLAVTAILLATAVAVTYRLRATRRRVSAPPPDPHHTAPAVPTGTEPAAPARP
jgi:hypothetical protein